MATLEYVEFRFPNLVTKFVNENKVDVVSITYNKNENVFVVFYTEETLAKRNEEVKNKSKAISPQGAREKFKQDLDPLMIEAVNNLLTKEGSSTYITLLQKDIVSEYRSLCKAADRPARDVYKENQLDFEDIFRDAGWHVEYDKPAYCETYEPNFSFSAKKR